MSQVNLPTAQVERIIEEIFQNQDQDVNYEELYEVLLLYLTTPININQATINELESLYILNQKQIRALVDYIDKRGPLISKYELQAIPEFDLITIKRLVPFVNFDERNVRESFKGIQQRIWTEQNNYLLLRYERILETKKGFRSAQNDQSQRYIGNADKLYARFRTSRAKDFSLGFTLEKDAGETFSVNTNQAGFDYNSYHLQIQNKGILENIILGDFQVQYGQGLVFGAGFNFGKGAETITTTRRINLGGLPYTSVTETDFFRGVLTTVRLDKKMTLTTLYSSLDQDAILVNDSVDGSSTFIRSIQTSGLHRTPSERAARNSFTENNYGVNFQYVDKGLEAGVNILNTDYSVPILRGDNLANSNRFSGSENRVVSIYAQYRKFNYIIFSEVARSNHGTGSLVGFTSSLSKNLEISVVGRNYENDFHSFYASGLGESSSNRGERGIYFGIKHFFNQNLFLSVYFDGFKFTDIRSNISRPSVGYEYLSRLTFTPNKKTLFYAQFRQQSKAENITTSELDGSIRQADDQVRSNYLINLDYDISDNVSLKSRVQGSVQVFNDEFSEGFALVQDLNFNYKRWQFSGRIAFFDTENFDNRQYIYERDVLYAFSIPALSGRGVRSYLVMRFKASQKLDFWFKYARSAFSDRKTIGSGLEEIDDSKRTTIKIQSRIRF
ncbi:MAG: helix-hairpin-helix domain-containing protein [Bacteroidota bacterium]